MQELDDDLESRLKDHVINMGLFRCPIEGQPPKIQPYSAYGYEKAQQYIENQLSDLGVPFIHQPVIDEGQVFYNIIAGDLTNEPVSVLTAHYDTAYLCGGADDNGSSVAVLLEVIRLLPASELPVQIVFLTLEEGNLAHLRSQELAWLKVIEQLQKNGGKLAESFSAGIGKSTVTEEELTLKTLCGSKIYVQGSREKLQQVTKIVNLESVGYYSSKENSQEETFNGLLPSTGNFLAVLCDDKSFELARLVQAIGEKSSFPLVILQKEQCADVDLFLRADHHAFWEANIPAITLTDTLEHRYDYYHLPLDLPGELDYQKMAQLVRLLVELVKTLITKQE
ncbi:MAG: M28 family peptidase [Candidatus Odinarchaeota archaeon]